MSSSSGSSSDNSVSWIDHFLGLPGNELLTRIDEEFIEDSFNLTGLKKIVADYSEALSVILDSDLASPYDAAAGLLYGLIHARFITTAHGLQLMLAKFERGDFGRCQRYLCFNNAVLPIGLADTPSVDTVKLFCPRCQELYNCASPLDGAFFGTSSTPMLLLANPHLVNAVPRGTFELKIYGFAVHSSAFVAKPAAATTATTAAAASAADLSAPVPVVEDVKDEEEEEDCGGERQGVGKKRDRKRADDDGAS